MAKLKFDDLSAEIKALFIDKILRPSDLKNVCLVNKQLHSLAVKPLYRKVSLDLGSPNDKRLSAFLSSQNIGLKHIREIRIDLANVRDRCNQEQQAHLVCRMLIELLPEDVLDEFRCGYTETWFPWNRFSGENLALLYRKQRRLKWCEVMDVDRDVLPELKKLEKAQPDRFKHARALALYPENRETLRLCEFFVGTLDDNLEEMILHANFQDSPDIRDPVRHIDVIQARELNDSATGPGLLSSTVFSHKMPFEKCEPFKSLKSLHLQGVNLRWCSESWCKFVNFTQIEHLRIYECPGADSLFGQMSRAAHLPKQLKTLILQHKDNAENEALLALDGFLCLVSGLRHLTIDMVRIKTLPAAAGIVRHGKTLEKLNVHGSQDVCLPISSSPDDCEELVWDLDDFSKICQACTNLEQLSCAWPTTSLIRAPSEDWKGFESQLENLKNLVTMHISSFPNNKPSSTYLPKSIYEQLLQGLAQRGFQVVAEAALKAHEEQIDTSSDNDDEAREPSPIQRESKLRLIAFGISDKIYEREESKNHFIYLRSTCQDAEGKTKVYATPIGWNLRQYVEPRSDVLDFVLNREARPPCRESRVEGSGIGWGEDDEFIDV